MFETGIDHGRPRARRLPLQVLLLAAFFGLLASACGGGGDSGSSSNTQPKQGNAGIVETEDPPQMGGKIVYALLAETNGWNPSVSQWAPSGQQVVKSIFDTLSAYDENSDIQPYLAERFEPSADYMQWTIHIRPGITLHNGKPVTAQLVADNQTFLKNSRLTSSAYEPVDSFSTDGDLKVIVKMKDFPWVNYPHALSTQIGVVVDQDWLASGNQDKPIGSGPFRFDHWIPSQKLIVKKNSNYWQFDSTPQKNRYPYLDEIEFQPIPDDNSRTAAMQSGGADIMEITTGDQIIRFKEMGENGDYQVFNATKGETSESFIQLNCMDPLFSDLDARMALAYATDKTDFIDVVAGGLYEPANGPFPPSSKWYNPEVETTYPQYNPEKAKELVEKVKAKNGGQFSFRMVGPPTPQITLALQQLQAQWQAVGIDAQIDTVEQSQLIVQVLTGQYQAVSWQQFAAPHPMADSIWWHPNTAKDIPDFALNFARNKDEEIGAALDDGRRTTDKAKELANYQFVQKRLAEDVPYIWLYHSQISIVAANDLVNVVNYKLPPNAEGVQKKGLDLYNGAHQVHQIWIKR